jgi:hypothetical protein
MSNEKEALAGVTDLIAPLAQAIENIRKWLKENEEEVEEFVRTAHRNVIFEKAGWLIHHSTPMHLITDEMKAEDIPPILEAYYHENWERIAAEFRIRVSLMNIDDGARAMFDEALNAHGAGLYRCTVRLVFPEIERFAREHLLNVSLKSLASLTEIRKATGEMGWSDLQAATDGPVFLQFGAMVHHVYEKVETPDRLAKIATSPIPNRHAALHGLISYNNFQSSLAAIIMAEFMFGIISYLVNQRRITP